MKTARQVKKQERRRNAVPSVVIAGYTNAGKSSLLNRLTGAGVLVENALFATLDPTVRRAKTADGRDFTLADTVGFAPFPEGPAGSKPYNVPSWALGINEASENKANAWKFIEWATSKEQTLANQKAGVPGARTSVAADADAERAVGVVLH